MILSASRGVRDRSSLRSLIDAARRAISTFDLNPAQVVWVEHLPPSAGSACDGSFQLIEFDWRAGHAAGLRRSPIGEAWYLSWLQGELYPSKLRQALESMLAT